MNILPKSQYEKVFDSSLITTQHIKLVLEEAGIVSMIRDDSESALRSGYGTANVSDVKLFVNKKDVLKAKHIITSTLENIDTENIPDADLEALAKQKDDVVSMTTSSRKQKKETYSRSPFNLFINVLIIVFSLYRLSPLLKGESLPTWRIALSGSLLLISIWAIVYHFKQKSTN